MPAPHSSRLPAHVRPVAVAAGVVSLALSAGLGSAQAVTPVTASSTVQVDLAQQDRNAQAVARWQTYRGRLAEAGITPPPARALARPDRRLPEGFEPVVTNGQVVPGVARVRVGNRTITVLSRQTIRTVTAALENLDKPFRPGRRGPRAYGCGGFMRAMWSQVGVEVPVSATTQYRTFQVVPRAQRQVGDLVLVGTPRDGFQHVGLWLGAGQMVAADGATGRVGVLAVQTRLVSAVRVTVPQPKTSNEADRPTSGIACGRARVTPPVPASGFRSPLSEGTFAYSARWGQAGSSWSSGYHTGLDFNAASGTPVYAAAAGTVRVRTDQAWAGPQFVQIDHHNNHVTWYAHMSYVAAQNGQSVEAGQFLGYVGSLGNSSGPHLHFETRTDSSLDPYRNGKDVNPLRFIDGIREWPAPGASTTSWGGVILGVDSRG